MAQTCFSNSDKQNKPTKGVHPQGSWSLWHMQISKPSSHFSASVIWCPTNSTQRDKGCPWLTDQVHCDREAKAAGPWSSWSHPVHKKEAKNHEWVFSSTHVLVPLCTALGMILPSIKMELFMALRLIRILQQACLLGDSRLCQVTTLAITGVFSACNAGTRNGEPKVAVGTVKIQGGRWEAKNGLCSLSL